MHQCWWFPNARKLIMRYPQEAQHQQLSLHYHISPTSSPYKRRNTGLAFIINIALFPIMTRAIPIHPAYVDSVKARDAAPLLHQIEDFEAFNKVVDAHCATFKVPEVIEEDRKVEFNGKTLDLTLLRPLGTEKEVLPVIIF